MATRQADIVVARGTALELTSQRLKPSLLHALRAGFSVYSTLSQGERRALQLRTRKQSSVRRLAKARGVPVSTLWRSLAAYLLYRRCPELASYQHLGISHVSLILRLDRDWQRYFLHKSEMARWSRQQLARELKRHLAKRRDSVEATSAAERADDTVSPLIHCLTDT